MNAVPARHPSKDKLAAFLAGRLPETERAQMERHVAECASCCEALAALPDDTLQDNLRAGKTPLAPLAGKEPGPAPEGLGSLPRELLEHPRYRIVKLIGSGGMGEVYLAEHRLMERQVALKVLHRSITRDPQAVERFRVEVKAAARLSHPNIVTAYDAEQAGDIHFLVMEHIDGISLARFVHKRGPLPVAEACHFTRQAALGLEHAFEHGMVHRDIKPQNLMLRRNGQVKILDFGLARLAHGSGTDAAYRITELGAVIGTPDYIAPEQIANARATDIRGDIYSLGCTLYFLLTAQTPFPRGGETQKIVGHLERTPQPLSSVRADVPPEVVRVVEKMMAKDPAQRFATPRDVAQALAPLAKQSTPRSTPAAPPPEPEPRPPVKLRTTTKRRPAPKATRLPRVVWGLLALIPVALVGLLATGALLRDHKAGTSLVKKDNAVAEGAKVVPVAKKEAATVTEENRAKAEKKQAVGVAAAKAGRPRRVLMVLTHRGFWDPDYRPVRAALEEKGIEVKVASTELTQAMPHQRGGDEVPVDVDLLIAKARVDDFDAVYFAGAGESDFVGKKPGAEPAQRLIQEMLAAKKHVSGLSMGVQVLADAGVLKERPAARTKRWFGEPYADAAEWDRETPIVISDTIITGSEFEHGPELGAVLAAEILKARRPPPMPLP